MTQGALLAHAVALAQQPAGGGVDGELAQFRRCHPACVQGVVAAPGVAGEVFGLEVDDHVVSEAVALLVAFEDVRGCARRSLPALHAPRLPAASRTTVSCRQEWPMRPGWVSG